MSVFYDENITTKGRELLVDVMGGASFTPTKISIGQGYLPIGTTTRNITALVNPVKELEISKSNKIPPSATILEGSYLFGGVFSNVDVTADFYFRELGLYAKGVYADGTETAEVLYAYGNAGDNAELIPAYGASTVIEKQINVITYVGNDAEVRLEITSGLTVTVQEFDDHVNDFDIHVSPEDRERWNNPAGNCEMLLFPNKRIASTAWIGDTTYADYPYRASIPCEGVTANHIADVTFSVTDAMSGNYAPVCETGNGVVYIYAAEIPAETITVQVEARKAVTTE